MSLKTDTDNKHFGHQNTLLYAHRLCLLQHNVLSKYNNIHKHQQLLELPLRTIKTYEKK